MFSIGKYAFQKTVRTDKGRLGLLQEAHERAGFPGYVESIIVRDIQLVALPTQQAARHSSATSRGQQEDRARAPSRGLVLPSPAVIAMGC